MPGTIDALLKAAAGKVSRSEARLLLAHVLHKPVEYLIAHNADTVEAQACERYRAALDDAARGKPIPYILGRQAFWGRDFTVTPAVLIPRPDTETLVETVLNAAQGRAKTVLELGTGSGCIAVTLALENPLLTVTATDVSSQALTVARNNAQRLGARIAFREGSWFDAVAPEARFDIIASNPPYIADGDSHLPALSFEPTSALTSGPEGLDDIRVIADQARRHLTDGGLLAFEHGFDQGKAARKLLASLGYTAVVTVRDLGGNDRVTKGRFSC